MKQFAKYLFSLILFAGIACTTVYCFASDENQKAEILSEIAAHTEVLTEKNTEITFSLPKEILVPASNLSGMVVRENRVEPSASRPGFTPAESYLNLHSGRDYSKNYIQIESEQETLLPYIDPSLEYVFLLRRILV